MLIIKNVRGGFSEIDILNGVDLEVAAKEIVTIAGTNGAGKSTLAKAIMGLLPRVSGSIAFNGIELSSISAEERVGHGIAYVPQVANIFSSLTVFENLDVVEFAGTKRARRSRAEEILDRLPRLRERLKTRGDHLSGGERQQLAFARALMLSPKLMLLDEPTAALSVALVDQVFKQIQELPALGVAALVIEQQARQSLAISNRGYILDAGRVVMSGPAQQLLADEKMASLYLGQRNGAEKSRQRKMAHSV